MDQEAVAGLDKIVDMAYLARGVRTDSLSTTSSRIRLLTGPGYTIPKSFRLIENSLCIETASGGTVIVAGKVIAFLTPCNSRFPVTVCVAPLSPPDLISVEMNVAFGNWATSKKSADFR